MSAILVALFAAPVLNTVRADEGMWTFNNVPRAEIKRKYGFDVTDALAPESAARVRQVQ